MPHFTQTQRLIKPASQPFIVGASSLELELQPEMRLYQSSEPVTPPNSIHSQLSMIRNFEPRDFKQFGTTYPFVLGAQPYLSEGFYQHTTKPKLNMGEYRQMKFEFERIRRDELLILSFTDIVFDLIHENNSAHYQDLTIAKRLKLAAEIHCAGLDQFTLPKIHWFMSKFSKLFGQRYHDSSYDPIPLILELISMIRANIVDHDNPAFEDIEYALEFKHTLLQSPDLIQFARSDHLLPPFIITKKGCSILWPSDFLKSPANFIERQACVTRGDIERDLANPYSDLIAKAHDPTRLRRFIIDGKSFIAKRIEPLRVVSPDEEIERAINFNNLFPHLNLSDCRTADYVAQIYSDGNFYIIMHDEGVPNLETQSSDHQKQHPNITHPGLLKFNDIYPELQFFHPDCNKTNTLWHHGELVFIDFENRADSITPIHLPKDSPVFDHAKLSLISDKHQLEQLPLSQVTLESEAYRWYTSALTLVDQVRLGYLKGPVIALIGDVHGNNTRLQTILNEKQVQTADYITLLGDYNDRDTEAREVFETLKSLALANSENRFIIGNHEIIFMLAMTGDIDSFCLWLRNGGFAFINSVTQDTLLEDYCNKVFTSYGRIDMSLAYSFISLNTKFIQMYEAIIELPLMQEINTWLLEHGQFFERDPYGMLYVHAAASNMQVDQPLDMEHFAKLWRLENEFKSTLRSKAKNKSLKAKKVFFRLRSIMELREDAWLFNASNKKVKPEDLATYVTNMGIRGTVYGHSFRYNIRNTDNRFFNIDLSMNRLSNGPGGF